MQNIGSVLGRSSLCGPSLPRHWSTRHWDELVFFFSSRRRHTRFDCDWSSDVCSSDLLGDEFGATTGRPRRCGWFDAVVVRYAVRVNGLTGLAVTKLDVLDSFSEIPVCVGYRCAGESLDAMPAEVERLDRKSTRLNSSHSQISYAVFCLKK